MLKDSINNAEKYYSLSAFLESGLRYLQNTDFSTVQSGKHEIQGSDVYACVQDYYTKTESEAKFEAHRKYIDIQYIVEGQELIGVSDISGFESDISYNEEKDIEFLKPKNNPSRTFERLNPGEFLILLPQDAHMPSISVGENATQVKKVVVKVRVK